MDRIDLEAATKQQNSIERLLRGERDDDIDTELSLPLDKTPTTKKRQLVRPYLIAQAIVKEVFQALPEVFEQQLGTADNRLELLEGAAKEEDTVFGAKEDISTNSELLGDNICRTRNEYSAVDPASTHPLANPIRNRGSMTVPTHVKHHTQEDFPRDFLRQSTQANARYDGTTEVMTMDEIEEQNGQRRKDREKWRGSESWAYLEDPWKFVRRGNEPLFTADEQRKGLQLELMDALFSRPSDPDLDLYLDRGLPAIICWVGLIGLRLSKFATHHEEAVTLTRVLIECVWTCNLSPSAKVGDVLESCYRRRIFKNPYRNGALDDISSINLRTYIGSVRISIYLLNILYNHTAPRFNGTEDLNEALSMQVSQAEENMRIKKPEAEPDVGKGPFYNVSDFSLEHLQNLGELQIQWTPYWDEHLELETKGRAITLKLYWFSPCLARYFRVVGLYDGFERDHSMDRVEEIYRTLDLVLNPNGDSVKSKKQYGKLKAPEWLSLLAYENAMTPNGEDAVRASLSRFQEDRGLDRPKYCCEIEDHLEPFTVGPIVERITHLEFPFYYQRLKELRSYMDSRQPRGLRALWRDRRNTNAYYTFWLVIIFSGIGVLLGFCTLAVAIIQAWAQLQTLHE
ncbi:MAG: hypothetical protein Q9178_007955 [Gyalolechia marmorata]